MTRRLIALMAALLAVVAALAFASPAAAEVETSGASVEMPDPASITFSIQVSGDAVADARLVYRRFNPEGGLSGEVDGEVPSRGSGLITAELDTNSSTTYIPVGTQFTYYWRLIEEDGSVTETEEQSFVFLDGRFDWQELEEGGVRVFWYADQALAQSVLQASAGAVSDMTDLLDVEIDFPINVVLYGGTEDGLAAQQPRGGVYDELSRTGGTRVAPDIVHVYDSLGLSWEDITRHEITHVVTSQAGDGAFTSIPSWLDEGLATYAQAQKGGRAVAVDMAIQTDTTLRLRNLAAPVNRADQIELFYGQSWAVVEYLINTYGEDQMAALLASIKSGNRTDAALEEVYGFDQDGLYNEWRESVGLEPIEYEPIEQATGVAPAEGTRPPLSLPTSVTGSGPSGDSGSTDSSESAVTPGAGSDGDDAAGTAEDDAGNNLILAIVVGVVTLLIAGALGAVGLRMMRS